MKEGRRAPSGNRPTTEAIRAEELQPQDAASLRVLVERYLDGVALIVGGKVRYANRALAEITGYNYASSQKLKITDFLVPDDRQRAQGRVQEVLSGGSVYTSNYTVLRKDGSERPVEVTSRSFEYEGQLALLSVIRDVSDRADVEARLRTSEERYRVLYEKNPSMYFTVDARGTVLSVNTFGAEQLGYTPAELTDQAVLKVFLEEDHQAVRDQLERCLALPDQVHTWELRKVRKDGSILWVQETARTVHDAELQPLVLIVCEEITERKQADEELRARQAQLRTFSELTADCCWVRWERADGSARREWITGNFERLTGYTHEEFEEIGREGLIHADDLPAVLEYVDGPPGVSEHEFRIVTKSGELRWLHEQMRVDTLPDGSKRIHGATRDVTAKREAEEALQLSQERLHQSQKMEALGTLAGGIAHDFNNLMMVVSGYGDLLQRTTQEGKEQSYVEAIRTAAERATSLTNQLLAFGRKQQLEPRSVELNALITDMAEMLGRLVPESIEIELRLDPAVGQIRIDPGQLEQVVVNLVVNARDAMSGGGRIVLATADVQRDHRYFLLRVTDDGCGMDHETLEHIFEPFFTTKGPGEGTGLGLSAVYGIVRQSGGHIQVSSEPGRGASFEIHLPASEQPADPVVQKQPSADVGVGSETILLVEDEAMVRKMVREALSAQGYTVLEASRPSEALRICKEHEGSIDLMLTDIVLPEMNGATLAERATAERSPMKVLFMSGYSTDALDRQGDFGSDFVFLKKPISPEELSRRVREILDGSS